MASQYSVPLSGNRAQGLIGTRRRRYKEEIVMKLKFSTYTAIVGLLAALAIPARLSAQKQTTDFRRYKLIDVGTFGGPESNTILAVNAGPIISRRGTTVGTSATSVPTSKHSHPFVCGGVDGAVPFVFHGFKWHDGAVTDLGALPPVAHNCSEAQGVNQKEEIALNSENGIVDPLTGIDETRGVRWKDGKIEDLGTFGGNNSLANQINGRGQIAGAASNTTPDPFSIYYLFLNSSNGTQTRAFLWENGNKRDLGTLGSGNDAIATFVNERGEVAGSSYTDASPNPTTGFPTLDPFLWTEDKGMIDLGTLGGTVGGPNALNNRGQVIGSSNLAGDQISDPFLWNDGNLIDLFTASGGVIVAANAINDAGEMVGLECLPSGACDAYLWKNGTITDLGVLPGDCCSVAFAINARGQVVGQSFTRAFLWENGSMIDLNSLIPSNSNLQLLEAQAINDRGEIAGDAFPPGCIVDDQCVHAFVLIPVCADGTEGCADAPLDPAVVAQSRVTPGTAAKTMTPEELATFKARIMRTTGRNRGFGLWRRK
jgi:probable HAF family extracellular repeat protein